MELKEKNFSLIFIMGLYMNFNPEQKIFVKGHIKDKEGHFSVFSQRVSPLDTSVEVSGLAIIAVKSIPKVRYGSIVYSPSKRIACYYWFLGIKLAFLPKTCL